MEDPNQTRNTAAYPVAPASLEAVQADVDTKASIVLLILYLIDAVLLAGFCFFGIGRWSTPLAFVVVGVLASGLSAIVHRRSSGSRLDAPGAILGQAGAALLLTLGVIATDPAMLIPMLLTQVVMVSTSAARLLPWQVVALSAGTAAIVVWLPSGGVTETLIANTPAQRLMLGLWLLWTLVKGAGNNLIGMTLRLQLEASHKELATALARVQELAERDMLTGLYNRRRIMELLEQERERSRRTGLPFAVAVLDIDHFKQVNDHHGHAAGDAVLHLLAQVLNGCLRNHDVLGRYGGEEFVLLLPGVNDTAAALSIVERLRKSIERQDWSVAATGLQITASIGVAVSAIGESASSLLERSDRSLYAAKHAGRNCVKISGRDGDPSE